MQPDRWEPAPADGWVTEFIETGRVTDFEEALRESNIPFLVEARDWARLSESFHREIEREYLCWWRRYGRAGDLPSLP